MIEPGTPAGELPVAPQVMPPRQRHGVRRFLLPTREFGELLFNRVITHIPRTDLRLAVLRRLGLQAGPHTYFFGGVEFLEPHNVRVGGNLHVGRHSMLDGRGGISIGHDVVLGPYTIVLTADHDPQSPDFTGRIAPVRIGDRVFVGTRSTILRGVTIGEGAVVAAGSVVHRDVEPWTIVGGVPAVPVGKRNPEQTYRIDYGPRWY